MKKHLVLLPALLLFAGAVFSQATVKVWFATPGNFTVPEFLKMEATSSHNTVDEPGDELLLVSTGILRTEKMDVGNGLSLEFEAGSMPAPIAERFELSKKFRFSSAFSLPDDLRRKISNNMKLVPKKVKAGVYTVSKAEANGKKVYRIALHNKPMTDAVEPADASRGAGHETKLVSIETSGCYGSCPIYKMTINKNGEATYEGIRFVKTKGKKVFAVTMDELADLDEAITDANLWRHPDRIDSKIQDAQWVTLTVYQDHKEKKVTGSIDRPEPLLRLEKLLVEVAFKHGIDVKKGVDEKPELPKAPSNKTGGN